MIWFDDEKPRKVRDPGKRTGADATGTARDGTLPADRAGGSTPAPEAPRPRDERPPDGKS